MIRNLLFSASVIALGVTGAPPANAQSVSGAYLAGRHAAVRSDFAEAADYYGRALARDSMNVELLESTILAYLSYRTIWADVKAEKKKKVADA